MPTLTESKASCLEELTDKELLDTERITIQHNPLKLVESNMLHIKTKAGEMVRLELNTTQKKLFNKIVELRKLNKPIRLWLLKYRQGGMCLDPNTKVLTSDLKWVRIDDLEVDDNVVCTDEDAKTVTRRLRNGTVQAKKEIIDEAFQITLEDGRTLIATANHRFLTKKDSHSRTKWTKVNDMREGLNIRNITRVWGKSNYEDGWFGGMIDGEGSIRRTKRSGYDLKLTQRPGPVCDRMRDYLIDNDYKYQEYLDVRSAKEGGKFSGNPVVRLTVSRIDELFRIVGLTRPTRLINKLWWANKALPCRGRGGQAWFKIVKIESIGRQRMIDLQTSHKTYIAEGFVSHNSTLIESIIYALTSQRENTNSLILADEKDHASNLFEMSKLYQEKLEETDPHIPPALKKSNEKKLEFDGIHSQILIASAENTEAAKSRTFQLCHLSEIAYFRDFKTIMGDLNQTVPDLPNTMVIGETTANGMGDFYKEWLRAVEGKTDWIPLFFPWFEMDEYSLKVESGIMYPLDGILFDADTSIQLFEQEEKDLQEEHKLTDEQINWRRYAIVNKCQGDLSVFNREYPATWELAFSSSGELFFDRKGLEKQMTKRPIAIGEIFFQNLKWEWRDIKHGRIELFERPQAGEEYLVTGDASEAVGADEASILVLNKRLNTTAAIVAGQITPEELAQLEIALGNYFNLGLIAQESKGYGYQVNQLIHSKYGNIYRKVINKDGIDVKTEELGFNTTSVTRPSMLAQLAEEVKNNTTDINSEKIISQMRTFIIKKDKVGKVTKIESQDGYQDGLVICRAIASYVRNQYPYKAINTKDTHAKQKAFIEERRRKKGFGG